jgi:glycerol-3-phosphate acyltransferase PlsY
MTVHPAVGFAIAYAAGSVPAAYLAGRSKGVDLRKHGSGNLGATNVVRTLGWKIGLVVFLFDALKGALPVLYLPPVTAATMSPELLGILYGLGAIIGHARPLFLGFRKGGKGVATSAGVFAALAPVALLVSFVVFAVVLMTSGYVSLGSLLAAVVLPVVLAFTHGTRTPIFAVSLLLAAFVFWTHRANIGRLRRGEEHRFGRKATG